MRRTAATLAVLAALSVAGCKGDDVDVNPGKGNDGVGNVEPGDNGDDD